MGGMWPVLTRTLRARPLRALLTALAVALGVAAVLAVQVTLTALDRQAGDAAGHRAGRSDLDVRAVAGAGLDAAQLVRLRATAGVAEVQPLYEKRIAAGTARDQVDSVQVTLVAVTAGEAALRPVVVTEGRLPSEATAGHEVALDADVAQALGARSGHRLRVGEQVYLTTATGPQAFRVSGITAGTGAGPGFTRSAAFVSLADATGPFALGIHAPLAALRLDPATAPAAVASRVRAALGPVAATVDPRGGVDEPLSQVRPLLALVVVLSLILGAGVSANCIAVSAVERRRDTGLLRVAGASRRQVLGLFASETALIALAGAGLGLVAGVGLAALLVHLAAAPDLPLPSLAPSPGQLGAALAAGFGAAFAGASIPALAAARLPALSALRSTPGGDRERPLRGSAVAASACWGAAAVLLLVDRAVPVAVGVVLALLGLALLLPIIAPALLRGLAALLAPVLPRAPVAAANLARRRNRSGLVLGVLTISVAAAVALASLTSGAMAAGNEWVGHLFAGDTVLVSPATARDEVAGQISASAGMAVGRLRFLSAPVDGLIVPITGADLEPYVSHGGLDVVEGDRSAALERTGSAPAVIVPQQLADRYGWHLGHVLRLDPGSGGAAVALTVVGVAAHTFPGGDGRESLIMGHDQAVLALGSVAAGFDDLQMLGGATRAGDLQTVAASFGMQVTAVADIQDAAQRSLAHSLQLLAALGWLGVVIAMLAVINTLVVNARQGTRELALLRAVGLSRRHALRLVLVEAALLGAAGVLVGSVAGCAVALPMLRVSASSGFTPHFGPPLTAIAALAALVVAGAMLAAYLPARRVVGADIVGAIRYE